MKEATAEKLTADEAVKAEMAALDFERFKHDISVAIPSTLEGRLVTERDPARRDVIKTRIISAGYEQQERDIQASDRAVLACQRSGTKEQLAAEQERNAMLKANRKPKPV